MGGFFPIYFYKSATEPKKPPPENQPREITRERPPIESPETNKPSKTKTDGKKKKRATNPSSALCCAQ